MPKTSKSDEAHVSDSQHGSYFNSVLRLKVFKLTAGWEVESGCKVFKDKPSLEPYRRDSKLPLLNPRGKKITNFFLQVETVLLKPILYIVV